MSTLSHVRMPPPGLGMAALVLGAIGLLLFFLPILGIPLSVAGIALGVAALLASTVWQMNLRWAIAGLATSCLALTINLAIWYAPGGYLRDPSVPRMWQAVPDRPYAPPPAKPGF
ncbi:MAG TPA: hypothetical protein VFE62_02970 [Gemmataceae bacterium]|nr:hypothetical protein [Gemmataceae bacterium]